jgi:hypothetical protein
VRFCLNLFRHKVDRITQYGGSRNETAMRSAFYNLLNEYSSATFFIKHRDRASEMIELGYRKAKECLSQAVQQ